jgi:hypothetical protein
VTRRLRRVFEAVFFLVFVEVGDGDVVRRVFVGGDHFRHFVLFLVVDGDDHGPVRQLEGSIRSPQTSRSSTVSRVPGVVLLEVVWVPGGGRGSDGPDGNGLVPVVWVGLVDGGWWVDGVVVKLKSLETFVEKVYRNN